MGDLVSGKRHANIPSNPHRTYKHDGWQGYGNWRGTIAPKDYQFLPFKEALLYTRSLKLTNEKEWKVWRKSGRTASQHAFLPRKGLQARDQARVDTGIGWAPPTFTSAWALAGNW